LLAGAGNFREEICQNIYFWISGWLECVSLTRVLEL